MNLQTSNEKEFTRYLLGDMSDDEFATVEAALSDDQTYEQFFLAEQNLIESYLTGQLDSRERQLFEDNYLDDSIERLEKVANTKAVLAVLPVRLPPVFPNPPTDETWRGLIGGGIKGPVALISYAAGVLIVSISIIIYFKHETSSQKAESERTRQQLEETTQQRNQRDEEIGKLRATLDRLQQERDFLAKREEELRAELENQSPKQSAIFLSLSPFGVKGPEGENPQRIGRGVKLVHLSLELRPTLTYETYSVQINGKVVAANLRPKHTGKGLAVSFQIFPRQLNEGINTIELSGRSDRDEYQKVDGYSVQINKR